MDIADLPLDSSCEGDNRMDTHKLAQADEAAGGSDIRYNRAVVVSPSKMDTGDTYKRRRGFGPVAHASHFRFMDSLLPSRSYF